MKQSLKQSFSRYQRSLPRNPVKRDFVICLAIWLVLEIVCFAIVFAIPVSPVEIQPQKLFLLSILLGFGGVCLMASSTQIALSDAGSRGRRERKHRIQNLGTQVLSWLGLMGIAFPLLVLVFQIALKILAPLRE